MSRERFRQGDSPIWHPFTPNPFSAPRTVWKRASGAYVWDDEGNRYLDGTSSWWCITHGHCHPRLVDALARQAGELDQVMLSPHGNERALELAEVLLEKLGAPFTKIFYSDDGSTAVEAALKMAVQYWHNVGKPRSKFLSLEMGYHGDTMGAVSVSHVSQFHHWFEGMRVPCYRATVPYCYRCPVNRTYPSCDIACTSEAERAIDEHGDEIAALFIEPLLMGVAGMVTYPKEYVERVVRKARSRGILVIFDEVFTGFGRTGTLFAMDQLAVKPDIVCLSKGLTAGMLPLAVTATTSAVFDAFDGVERAFYHGHTFTGNALGCAVALESLKLFEEERTLERIAGLTEVFQSASGRFRELPHVGDIRQTGPLWVLELVDDAGTRQRPTPANGPGWELAKSLWAQGIWVRPLYNMLYLLPPYCTPLGDLQRCLTVLYSELSKEVGWR